MSLLDDVSDVFAGLDDLVASATLSRYTPGTYDPSTGTNATGTTATSTTTTVLDASSKLGYIFGPGLVQGGDIMALVPAKNLTFTPKPGDTLTAAGETFTIVQVIPTWAGSTPVLFQCLVRK